MFHQRKNFFWQKKKRNYASFVLKFGTKKKIFYNYTNNLCRMYVLILVSLSCFNGE